MACVGIQRTQRQSNGPMCPFGTTGEEIRDGLPLIECFSSLARLGHEGRGDWGGGLSVPAQWIVVVVVVIMGYIKRRSLGGGMGRGQVDDGMTRDVSLCTER